MVCTSDFRKLNSAPHTPTPPHVHTFIPPLLAESPLKTQSQFLATPPAAQAAAPPAARSATPPAAYFAMPPTVRAAAPSDARFATQQAARFAAPPTAQ